IVDLAVTGVGASQRRERSHHAILPLERQTLEAGSVSAEVFIIWVHKGSFGPTYNLAESVGASRSTVRPSESGLADVRHQATVPEDGVLCAVRGGLQTGYQAMVIHESGLAKRAVCRAEVGDDIARFR